MIDPPQLLKPSSARHISSHSPERRRHNDDLLAHLKPSTVVRAISNAEGSLKLCLENTSPAERDFLTRTAITSNRIWEWLEELDDWNWPSRGGSRGFEAGTRQSAKSNSHDGSSRAEEEEHIGSLPRATLGRYEARIEEISIEIEKLDIEEIKGHVLADHIFPLSRPTTPMSIRSGFSTRSSFNKMEDFTAIVTAIVVQTLPNLAKLTRLLQTWSIRLRVLRQIPSLLLVMEDAEVALRSGWNAIATQAEGNSNESAEEHSYQSITLIRDDFNVMKKVLERRIAKPGRTLDHMLDCLEGSADTLPESWLDRMETLEHDYVEWVTACEQKLREETWSDFLQKSRASHVILTAPAGNTSGQGGTSPTTAGRHLTDSATDSYSQSTVLEASTGETEAQDFNLSDETLIVPEIGDVAEPPDNWQTEDGEIVHVEVESPIFEDDLQLPILTNETQIDDNTMESQYSFYETTKLEDELFSEPPEISASPAVSRSRIREAEYLESSPPSSPPWSTGDFTRELSVPLPESPQNDTPRKYDYFGPTTPDARSGLDEDETPASLRRTTSPSKRRESVGEQHFRHQLTQIIDALPAKIKLTNEPPRINLNPPDLQLPKLRKKPSLEPFSRSASGISSAMSSRAGTPSFTLSPAKNGRRPRGQQEIKVYHLSRSTGEAPIKLHIRCVGETGERVMVRVGGGWADLSEYLKEYASHHGRRSASGNAAKVEVRDLPRVAPSTRGSAFGSSPPAHTGQRSRPGSALAAMPTSPLTVHKVRRSTGAAANERPRLAPKTPLAQSSSLVNERVPSGNEDFTRLRSNSGLSWKDEDSSFLGLSGPSGRKVEMSAENKAWVESVKQKVRIASGEKKPPVAMSEEKNRFGQINKVGGTKRLFPKGDVHKDARR